MVFLKEEFEKAKKKYPVFRNKDINSPPKIISQKGGIKKIKELLDLDYSVKEIGSIFGVEGVSVYRYVYTRGYNVTKLKNIKMEML